MTPSDFIARYAPAAQNVCRGTGLLASICLAQAILESGWGESGLGRRGNNFFGMKKSTSWKGEVLLLPTKEFLSGKWVTIQAPFKKYPTPEAAFEDRVALFRRLSRYQRLFRLDDYQTEARLLRECGYATDPSYPEKLVALVRKYNLTRFDA